LLQDMVAGGTLQLLDGVVFGLIEPAA
jgi:hypothetical protein